MISAENKKWRWLAICAFSCLGGFVCVVAVLCQYMATSVYFPEYAKFEERLALHQAAILKDLRFLDEKPIFNETVHTADAQDFLSQHISWSGGDFKPLNTAAHEVLDRHKDLIGTWSEGEKHVQNLLSQSELMSMDVSWVDEIFKYDHWNFSSHPVVKSQMQQAAQSGSFEQIMILSALPMPDTTQARKFLIVYFLQHYKKGNAKKGLLALEHMAKLLHTSGNLVSNMSAVALLKTENKLKQILSLKESTLASDESLMAYKRVSWAWMQIALLPWMQKSVAVFEPYMKPQTAACVINGEPSASQDYMKDFFEPKFLFENDMSSNFASLRTFHKAIRKVCQAQHLEIFDQTTQAKNNPLILRFPASPFILAAKEVEPTKSLNWSRLPFVRRFVGSILLSIASPNWLRQYDELAEVKK